MSNNELNHSGIKGMRWGIRRYQNKDGSLTPLGKKRYGITDSKEDDSQKQTTTSPTDAKKKAMTSGDIREVAANRHSMTNDEFRKALDRVDLEQRLRDTDAKIHKSGFDKTMSAIDKIDKARGGVEKLLNVYGLIAKVNNTFNRHQLPTIDGNRKSDTDILKEQLLRTADADGILRNISSFKSSELQDAANILRNKDTVEQYTTSGKAKKAEAEAAATVKKQQDDGIARAKAEAEAKAAAARQKEAEAKTKEAEAKAREARAKAREAEAKAKEAKAKADAAKAAAEREKEKEK